MAGWSYYIDFPDSNPFSSKYQNLPFKEKAKTILQNPSKTVDILLPHLISLIGVLFFHWNFIQIIFVYLIDIFLDHIYSISKIALNQNLESLKGVRIKNTLRKKQIRTYEGSLTGLKIRTILYYSCTTFLMLFGISVLSYIITQWSPASTIKWDGLLIAGVSIFIKYLIEVIIFVLRKGYKVSLIGDSYIKTHYKIITVFLFTFLAIYASPFIALISSLVNPTRTESQNLYMYNALSTSLFALIAISNTINKEYFLMKKRQSIGVAILHHLRRYKIPFTLLNLEEKIDSNLILEAKLAKKRNNLLPDQSEYFLIVQDQKSPFSTNLLVKKLNIKNAEFCNTEEAQEVLGFKITSIPPFGTMFGLKTYFDKKLSHNPEIIIDLKTAGRLRIATKDYLELEEPEEF